MADQLSPDTQATLLLVGRFTKNYEAKPFSIAEYNRLAKQLHELELRPADLLREIPKELVVDWDRLKKLLARGTSLALAAERWANIGIKIVGRSDAPYPSSLKKKLRGAAAPILYVAGETDLLDREAVCIVGSREPTESGLAFATELGRHCAYDGLAVVSGDARGVDRAAMDGALAAGGAVSAVLVDGLAKAVLAKRNREPILDRRLVLVSPYDPDGIFTVPNAMDRNKYLYALASAAVIVDSDTKGGTWTGAIENDKHRWTPAFVRLGSDVGPGNHRLAQFGLPSISESAFNNLREFLFSESVAHSKQSDLLPLESLPPVAAGADHAKSLYEIFIDHLTDWLTDGPQPDVAIAERFQLERPQAKAWLNRALEAGILQKLNRPSRFAIRGEDADAVKREAKSYSSMPNLLL